MTILFILLLIKYFFVIIKVKVSRSGVIMTNKYRLKIIYKDTKLTLDIEENITFDELSSIINEKLMLSDSRAYKYQKDDDIIVTRKNSKNNKLADLLELDQKLVYIIGTGNNVDSINIIVWDYIIEADKKILEKFNQMLKNVKQVRPEQVYYLNSSQRKFIDGLLADCYEMLKEMSFSGIYNYRLFKNGADFLTTKVIYYILDDKYEIHLYNNNDDLKEDNTEYLITFYDTNRAYFKGYQGVNRNIFILHKDKTIKQNDFEYLYHALNRIIHMFKDGDEDTLFESHETCLCYDIATNKFWTE